MKSLAEERRTGTIELLMTKPLTDWDIIVGKYFAGFLLVIFSLLPTLVYYYSVSALGNPAGNIDTAGVMGSYIGLVLLGGVFCALGIFASSFSPNPILAFILSAFLCFIFFSGFNSLSGLPVWSEHALAVQQLGLLYHYESLSRGLVDSRDVVYFLSLIFVLLLSTKLILGSRQW
jgi:ABC-2 type transport system permease protein